MPSDSPTISSRWPVEDAKLKKTHPKKLLPRFLLPESPLASSHATKDNAMWAKLILRKPDSDKPRKDKRGPIKTVGRFLRRWGRSAEEDLAEEDQPRVRRVVDTAQVADRVNIPLAPPPLPPPHATIPQPQPRHGNYTRRLHPPDLFLGTIPDQYLVRPATADPTHTSNPPRPNANRPHTMEDDGHWNWSRLSTRKSSGSYSIYSTFGADSRDSSDVIIHDNQKRTNDSPSSTPYSSQQRDRTTRLLSCDARPSPVEGAPETFTCDTHPNLPARTTGSPKHGDMGGIETISEESSAIDEIFVDAQQTLEGEKDETSLTRRLSGGHFGSADGLVQSISDADPSTLPQLPKKEEKRNSYPPPEDLVEVMLNWKRRSSGTKRSPLLDMENKAESQTDADHLNLPSSKHTTLNEATTLTPNSPARTDPPKVTVPRVNSPDRRRSYTIDSSFIDQTAKMLSDTFRQTSGETWSHGTPVNVIQVRDPRQSLRRDLGDAQENAQRLWDEDPSIAAKDNIAEWLGQEKQLNRDTLVNYMAYFQFGQLRLDDAFRKLCSKLYFKAEAQQIDRILEAFSNRYFNCNPDTLYGSADVVHAIVYSLLLLNTDLHVAQGTYHRMTRQEFIKNTMLAVHDQCDDETLGDKVWNAEMETNLKELYLSVKHHQILQPMERQASLRGRKPLGRSTSLMGNRRAIGIKRSVHSMIRRSARESILVAEEEMNTAQASKTTLGRSASLSSVASGMSFGSRTRSPTLPKTRQQSVAGLSSPSLPEHLPNKPPYFKEGMIMRKHLLENSSQKAKHRDWKECLLIVSSGQLQMYATNEMRANGLERGRGRRLRARSTSLATAVGALNRIGSPSSGLTEDDASSRQWTASLDLLDSIPLNHTLSNPLPPPGYNRLRPYVFAIQQPDGGAYLFQSISPEQLNEWVSTCNYWAARESKEPLTGGVSNMEFGWGSCLKDIILDADGHPIPGKCATHTDAIVISDWKPPTPPTITSTLNEQDQYDALQKHLVALNHEINTHRELREKIFLRFASKSANHAKALANWEAKSTYLLHEIIKYQNYSNALEASLLHDRHQKTLPETERRLLLRDNDIDLFKEIGEELDFCF